MLCGVMAREPGRHRYTGPVGLFLGRIAGPVLAVAAVAIAFTLSGIQPPPPLRPFATTSDLFGVQITAARQAGALVAGPSVHDTQAIWLVVTLRITALQEPVSLGYAAVAAADGTTYPASTRLPQPLVDGTRILQPGITLQGDIAFEVPRHTLGHLTARFATTAPQPLGNFTEAAIPGAGLPLLQPPAAELAAPAVTP